MPLHTIIQRNAKAQSTELYSGVYDQFTGLRKRAAPFRHPDSDESISLDRILEREEELPKCRYVYIQKNSEADAPTISHQTDQFEPTIAVNSLGADWIKQVEQDMRERLAKIGSSDSLEMSKNLGELTVLIHPLNGVITTKGEGMRSREWSAMTDDMELLERPGCFQGSRRLIKPLTLLAATVCVMPLAAAADLAPHLRIGCGFTSVTTAVSLIPLRRDERAGMELLIPMYALSLTCTALFILLQYLNIVRLRGRYLFGTFLLAGHFVVGLSQTSDSALEGVVDFGPIIVPVVAAVFSLLFPRRQPILAAVAAAVVEDPFDHEELDIGLEGMQNLVGAAAPL
ncbi:hypothetical protein HD806DRAFT_520555 [Xylariaceae sp. AK1471]|nr:hypothetical protein HD806DRAFT_520555 [Xylariaceae sp. AK1471]